MKESKLPYLIGAMFLVTLATLLVLIVWVLIAGKLQSMMALSVVAYSLASLGFLGVIAWAYLRGQFINYEQIKEDIFELEGRE